MTKQVKYLVVALVILLPTFAGIVQTRHNAALALARAETKQAVATAQHALDVTRTALAYADSVAKHADSVEALAQNQAMQARIAANWAQHQSARADSVAAAAPDTCAAALAVALAARDAEHASAENWRIAYEQQKQAAVLLRSAGDTLANTTRDLSVATEGLATTSTSLVKASGTSFWSHLKPRIVVSVGVTRGIDLASGAQRTVAGLHAGLGWSL